MYEEAPLNAALRYPVYLIANDSGVLVNQHGFRLAAAGIVNMYPHTSHVESIALFERA